MLERIQLRLTTPMSLASQRALTFLLTKKPRSFGEIKINSSVFKFFQIGNSLPFVCFLYLINEFLYLISSKKTIYNVYLKLRYKLQ